MERPSEPKKRLAIIIAIENYRNTPGIPKVQYANNDAAAFRNMLIEHFGFANEEIIFWVDTDAVQNSLTNDLPYQIQQLSPEDQFIFYYAGHGFYQDGHNKLTCWDSHPFNLNGTTVSLQEVLFDPLAKSGCQQSLVFLDCCSSHLTDHLKGGRDVISDMNVRDFEVFIKATPYDALYMSCSAGEKSSSNARIQHGIWTYHLINALSGEVDECLIKGQFITSNSLQNYLSVAIPKFIREEKIRHLKQTPFARIGAANEFLIREIIIPEIEIDETTPSLELNLGEAKFRKITVDSVKKADGFLKNYTVPKFISRTTQRFVQTVFYEETKEEIQTVYENTKRVFNLRKSDIKYDSQPEGSKVECPFFNYYVSVEQHSVYPGDAVIIREIYPLVALNELPAEFDSIFPINIDELVIPIENEVDFDDLVSKFENLEAKEGGKLSDNKIEGTIEYITSNKTSLTVDTNANELIVTKYYPMKAMELIRTSIADIQQLSQREIKLLN